MVMACGCGRPRPLTGGTFYRPPRVQAPVPPVYRDAVGLEGKPDLVKVATGRPAVLIVGTPYLPGPRLAVVHRGESVVPTRADAERELRAAKRKYGFPPDAGCED
jgi:hypothetical protein